MIKTENGNDTLTFEEFAAEVRALVPATETESLKVVYDRLRLHYIIYEHCASFPSKSYELGAYKYIKEDRRHLYKAVLISLSYDCGPMGWCPQDCPFEILFINEEDGHVFSSTQIYEWVEERRKEREKEETTLCPNKKKDNSPKP